MHSIGTQTFAPAIWDSMHVWESVLDAELARIEPTQIELRRYLHSNPEPSGEEIQTSRLICERLTAAGLKPQLARNGLGVIVDVTVGNPRPNAPLIAIRADIDALRMQDAKCVPYASKRPNTAHACGHDAHTTMAVGAGLIAANLARSAGGTPSGLRLRLLFQPAEETSEGAQWLVEQGALDGVDAILGIHVDPERTVGTVGVRYGVLTAHCDDIDIYVKGRGGHAARPHHTIDPIAASAHLLSALYGLLPRGVDSRSPSVFSIGRIQGGTSPNVIPELVELHGTLRTTDNEVRATLKDRIASICAGAQLNTGAQITVEFSCPLEGVNNDARVAAALEAASRRVLGAENVQLIDKPSMGAEDFAFYTMLVPGAMLRLGCAPPGVTAPFLHSPYFDIDERTLSFGTRILLRAAFLLSLEN